MKKLDLLVEEWKEERMTFARVSKRFHACMNVFADLNKEIYLECKEQGIDIKTLKLNDNEG